MKPVVYILCGLMLTGLFVDLPCRAQYVRLNSPNSRNALYFDLSRVVNYNCYEHWRWGGGLYWVSPQLPLGPQWQVKAYGAYGQHDHQFKYGMQVARSFRGLHFWKPYLGFSDDITQNSSAAIEHSSSFLKSEDNVGIMSARFVRQQEALAGISARWNLLCALAEVRYMRQRILFDDNGLIYPSQVESLPAWSHFSELHLQASRTGVTADLRTGTAADAPDWWYMRSLIQYNGRHTWDSAGTLEVFLQTGAAIGTASEDITPLHRLFECFDLGGTYNSHYYFRNTLLTLPPESFMADCFVRGNLRYQLPVCGWNLWYSAPQPFVQTTATMGRHYQRHDWSAVGEAAAGVCGLLRWSALDMGCAVAYQFLNTSSGEVSLRPDSNYRRWAFMVCAKLVI